MKINRLIFLLLLLPMSVFSQEVKLAKTFPSIEMTAVKMVDQTTLYRIDTIHVRLGKYTLDEISCNVLLKDMNGNGRFNDQGVDEIGLLDQYTDTIYHSYQGGLSCGKINKNPAVLVDDMLLRVDEISDDGSQIKFTEVEEGTLIALAWTITYLPYAQLKTLSGKETNLVDYLQEEKYIYIEFWGTWCEPCINLMPEIQKINSLYKEQVKIASLNYGDKLEDVITFVKRNKLNWEQLLVDRSVLSKFSVTTVPRGILFDKTGKLIDMDISPSELKKFLENL